VRKEEGKLRIYHDIWTEIKFFLIERPSTCFWNVSYSFILKLPEALECILMSIELNLIKKGKDFLYAAFQKKKKLFGTFKR
jgi:hypothetical protein